MATAKIKTPSGLPGAKLSLTVILELSKSAARCDIFYTWKWSVVSATLGSSVPNYFGLPEKWKIASAAIDLSC
jgi:hypothetical protein